MKSAFRSPPLQNSVQLRVKPHPFLLFLAGKAVFSRKKVHFSRSLPFFYLSVRLGWKKVQLPLHPPSTSTPLQNTLFPIEGFLHYTEFPPKHYLGRVTLYKKSFLIFPPGQESLTRGELIWETEVPQKELRKNKIFPSSDGDAASKEHHRWWLGGIS